MQFKVDENLHNDVAGVVVSRGYDATTVYKQGLRGAYGAGGIAGEVGAVGEFGVLAR